MNTDKETLQRNLEDLRQKLDESKKVVLNLEVTLANRVTTVEEALDTYTGMLTTLGLYPTPPEPWQDIDLTLELNSASSNPQQLLIGTDIRKVIRPTLSSVAESKRQERAAIESESVKVNNDLDQSTIECKNLDYDMSEIEKKVAQLNEQADDLRDVRSSFLYLVFTLNLLYIPRLHNKRRNSPMVMQQDWNASSDKPRWRLSLTDLE
jgi:kinetochore protein NDC80